MPLIWPGHTIRLVLQLQSSKAAQQISAYTMQWTMLQENHDAAGALSDASKLECPSRGACQFP